MQHRDPYGLDQPLEVQEELALSDHRGDEAPLRGRLVGPRRVKDYALGGNAYLTIRSSKTGTRFTYRIRAPKEQNPPRPGNPIWFVSVLTGDNNESHYRYLGNIRHDLTYDHGRKSTIGPSASSAKAFDWFWNVVRSERGDLLERADVWHEGRCGRCGRKLTVPESVESGFGPECIQHVGERR